MLEPTQSGSIPSAIGQIASGDTNPHIIPNRIIIVQEKMGNGSAVASVGDRRRVGDSGGKSDVRSASTRNSLSHRIDVYRVGARKQGRELDVGIAGLVGVVNVSAILGLRKFSRVSINETIGA